MQRRKSDGFAAGKVRGMDVGCGRGVFAEGGIPVPAWAVPEDGTDCHFREALQSPVRQE